MCKFNKLNFNPYGCNVLMCTPPPKKKNPKQNRKRKRCTYQIITTVASVKDALAEFIGGQVIFAILQNTTFRQFIPDFLDS